MRTVTEENVQKISSADIVWIVLYLLTAMIHARLPRSVLSLTMAVAGRFAVIASTTRLAVIMDFGLHTVGDVQDVAYIKLLISVIATVEHLMLG